MADELVFADFVRPLVRRWRLLVMASIAGGLIALAAAALWPPTYTAEVSFTPEQSGGSGGALAGALGSLSDGLGSLADLPGGLPAGLSGGGSANSPEFFAGVLKSRELMVSTLESEFRDPADPSRRRPLTELLKPRGSTPARRLGSALRKLEKKAGVTVERRSGIVTLELKLGDPQLASDVANRMAELLNVYNLERRQSSSRQQRRFIEERLARAEEELRAAEQAQTAFLLENRHFEGSPTLAERVGRLARDVRVRQQLVLRLQSSYEDARIAEVRDTPVLSIVDHAAPADRPSNPRPLLWTVGGAVLGLAAAGVAVLIRGTRPLRASAPPGMAADGAHGNGTSRHEARETREPAARAELAPPVRASSERS